MHRKIQGDPVAVKGGMELYCDSIKPYKTLYINKIDAEITLDEDSYDARVSLYYIPDSIFFISAVNSGFEIVRIGIFKDSTMYINRLDKMMFIYKNNELGAKPPVNFKDFELLLNRQILCSTEPNNRIEDGALIVDNSTQNLEKKVYFSALDFSLKKFEFFQKKTSEYVVGETSGESEFIIYSNFIVDGLMLKTSGGTVEYDKEMNINLEVNRKKYEVLNL